MIRRFTLTFQRFLSVLLLTSMLFSQTINFGLTSDVLAAKTSQITPVQEQGNLFRTRVTLRASRDLERVTELGATVLESGSDWALLLVTADQLETLARLRFTPQDTNELGILVAAQTTENPWLLDSLQPVLQSAASVQEQLGTETVTTSEANDSLTDILNSVTVEQEAAIMALSSVDDDGDGLTNTQESWWCTDPGSLDSDGDGVNDGAEVAAAKAWLSNEAPSYPASGKPFVGWPENHAGCFDDDQDSIPDLAEIWELGLNANRESTDRDKFDDGQELFGNTYCPGTGGFCGYGALPRNEDWGIIFAEMPSWIESPGNHPLVAAFPVPEVDVAESSLTVEAVTVITTDHTISEGTQQTYSTAKTEGTSTGVEDTVTWNEWQEIALTSPQGGQQSIRLAQGNKEYIEPTSALGAVGVFFLGYAVSEAINCIGSYSVEGDTCWQAKLLENGLQSYETYYVQPMLEYNDSILNDDDLNDWQKAILLQCNPYNPTTPFKSELNFFSEPFSSEGLSCPASGIASPDTNALLQGSLQTLSDQDRVVANGGHFIVSDNESQVGARAIYPSRVLTLQPVPTFTESHGRSLGGAQTTVTSEYEEHTITNGEAFSNEESWGTATAVDSAHAADLWFSYSVSNTGMEYAREICDLAFNLYIGDVETPVTTYFVGPDVGGDGCFNNFMPDEEHTYTSARIPLTLEQMRAIDLGASIRIVVEDFTYGIDELFYEDASSAGVLIALEDGTDDGNEAIDTYLLPTWGEETVLDVVARYFPHETDADGELLAIWTPEYRSDTPAWCADSLVIGTGTQQTVWCKHALSTADWWNIYLNNLGDGSTGLQDTLASPESMALFRFNKDTDLDGYSDRSETRLGTSPTDPTDYPQPELLAGLNSIQSGNQVTATLSLLNTGLYDAYGVESVMIAPNPTVTITNNTVGGSGRVGAQQQVVVGSQVFAPAYDATTWQGSAQPFAAGYYTGNQNRIYTFTALDTGDVGTGTVRLQWDDAAGNNGTLDFGAAYASPTPLAVGDFGVEVGLLTGDIQAGDTFTVAAKLPADTFQYQIESDPYVSPVVLVSYNDPQGNHRFVTPITLTHPTENLAPFSGQMLENLGIEIVTQKPITQTGTHTTDVVVNWPADVTLEDAHLFLEFVTITGTVAAEFPITTTIETGPNIVAIEWDTNQFSPAYQPDEDYIVMVFWTDWQGNIIDTAARPLSSFQPDPQALFATDEDGLTWDFGMARQGTLMQRQFVLASIGYQDLLMYIGEAPGITVTGPASAPLSPADMAVYTMTINTEYLPTGLFAESIPIRTSDPQNPTRNISIQGEILPFTPDDTQSALIRPLDWTVTVSGTFNQGEWISFTHSLGPDPQTLQPVKVFNQDYTTIWGEGEKTTGFGQGTALAGIYGDGSDGDFSGGDPNSIRTNLMSTVNSGQITVDVNNATGFNANDEVLILQIQGTGAGTYEFAFVGNVVSNSITLQSGLLNSYFQQGNSRAQILRVPHYENVIGNLTTSEWDGNSGGVIVFRAQSIDSATITVSGAGFKGGYGNGVTANPCAGNQGQQGESPLGFGGCSRLSNGGGGGASIFQSGADFGSGGGGGYGSPGGSGTGPTGGAGGSIYGDATLSTLFLGSGGGAGNWGTNPYGGGRNSIQGNDKSGQGAGTVFLTGQSINGLNIFADGRVGGNSNGSFGGYAGGGGSGGSIKIIGGNIDLSTVQALGGAGGDGTLGDGGTGGNGRIRIEYCESLNGTTSPAASTEKLDCYIVEQIEELPYDSARLSLPESISGEQTYNVQYGRQFSFAEAGELTQFIRVPKQLYTEMNLDLLVSNSGTFSDTLILSLDIGDDGVDDWSHVNPVTFPATLNVSNVVDALNGYLVSRTDIVWGDEIDVPVRVTMDRAADLFLTNLVLSLQFNQPLGVSPLAPVVDVNAERPLDWTTVLSGTFQAGDWVTYTHSLTSDPQTLHPVFVYSSDFSTLWGTGKYAADFGNGSSTSDIFGDGSDGDLLVSSGQTILVDEVKAAMASSAAVGQSTVVVNDGSGFTIQDEVLIIQMQGANAGSHEFRTITEINNNALTLNKSLANSYTVGGNDKAQVLQVPHYQNVTVQNGGVLTVQAWDGTSGGILAFRASNAVVVNDGGLIDVSGKGFAGGLSSTSTHGEQGDSATGNGTNATSSNGTGGGGGALGNGAAAGGGGGGGLGTIGVAGQPGARGGGAGGVTGGNPELSTLIFGGAGGAGGTRDGGSPTSGGVGGNSGGIVFIGAETLTLNGNASIAAAGNVGGNKTGTVSSGGGGGGAGGSILLQVSSATIGNGLIAAPSGNGGAGNPGANNDGGAGGVGLIRIEYCDSMSGSTTPTASSAQVECHIVEQEEMAPFNQGNLKLPEAIDGSQSYVIQYGRRFVFPTADTQTNYLQVERQVYGAVSLDALINNTVLVSGTLDFCLDIGDDGVCNYTFIETTDFPTELPIDDLTAAFNDYLLTRNDVSWGDLVDVPVRVQVDQQADVILTNLALTPVGSKTRYVRLAAQSYDDVAIGLLFNGSGETSLSFTVDVGLDGTIDWSFADSLTLPASVTSPNLADAINVYLAGQTGEIDVPIRIIPSPFLDTALDALIISTTEQSDATLSSGDIGFSNLVPTEGEEVTVTATLHNSGGKDIEGVTAAFFATLPSGQETYIGSSFTPNIPAGGTDAVSIIWNTLGYTGTVPVRVVLDPFSRLEEIDNLNNEASVDVTILTRPDLRFSNITLSDPEPTVGETITLTVSIENAGQAMATGTEHDLYVGDPVSDGILIETIASDPLAGSDLESVEFTWTPAEPGPYQLFLLLDNNDLVNEFDEQNNENWQEIYVGFASPLLLDSGTISETAYSPASGYGYIDEGAEDTSVECSSDGLPENTLRRDPDGQIVYQFNHLLPGHFYHLDLILYECDGAGRQESVYVDGNLVAGPENLSDGTVHRLSLLLDPALYADNAVRITVEAPGIDGAVVGAVDLYDIDYRYADAGGTQDPQYPDERAYGWLDGVANTSWGILPYQSVRVDQDDDALRYRYDSLDPAKRYDLNFVFWQPSGTGRIQTIEIDGVSTGISIDTSDFALHEATIAVPPAAYADDNSIVISIVRTNASTGAMVNEIALEEQTIILNLPSLTIPTGLSVFSGETITVPISFASSGIDIASTTFSVDFDEACLSFDPTDTDQDGIPDDIGLSLPAGFNGSATFDENDVTGELDFFIADIFPPLGTLVDGTLATMTFTAICQPAPGTTTTALIRFSTDPAASFGNTGGQSVDGITFDGWVQILASDPGDCNGDKMVDAGDISALVLEIFDGDGNTPDATPGGTFAGNPACDANEDAVVNAGDITCAVLIAFNGPGACGSSALIENQAAEPAAVEATEPNLTIPEQIPALPGGNVTLPVTFTANEAAISSLIFSIDYDENWLTFDPTDSDEDGVPDSVSLNLPAAFDGSVIFDVDDTDGELDFFIADTFPPLASLADSAVVSVTLQAGTTVSPTVAVINFSLAPEASFGSTTGQSVPGTTNNGSVLIQDTCSPPSPPDVTAEFMGDDVVLTWTAVPGATAYDVYRMINDAYLTPALSYQTTASSSFTDVGVLAGQSDNYYYFVRAVNACGESTDSNRAGIFYYDLLPGWNLLSWALLPTDTTLDAVLGTQLFGTDDPQTADRVLVWNGETQTYDSAWFCGGPVCETFGDDYYNHWLANDYSQSSLTLSPDIGFWLQNRSGATQTLQLSGDVALSDRTVQLGQSWQLIGSPFHDIRPLDNANIPANGTDSPLTADRILYWDAASQSYQSAWFCGGPVCETFGDDYYNHWLANDYSQTTVALIPGHGVWYQNLGESATWENPFSPE